MMRRGLYRLGSAALLLTAAPAPLAADPVTPAKTLAEDARVFGVRESVRDISLSPSGTKIAYIAAGPDHSELVGVIDLEGDATPRFIISNSEKEADFDSCEWATEQQLVCQVSGMVMSRDKVLVPFDRLFAIDSESGSVQELSKRQ